MAQNSLEDYIKNTLDEKHIKPSDQARERLSSLLLETESKKKKRPWYYWSVAASIVLGLIFVGTQLFNEQESNTVSPIKVTFEKPIPADKIEESIPNKIETQISAIEDSQITESKTNVKPISKPLKSTYSKAKSKDFEKRLITQNPETVTNQKAVLKEQENRIVEQSIQLDSNPSINQQQEIYITPEALLAAVSKDSNFEIETSKKALPNTFVNPDKLLSNIESQIFYKKNRGTLDKIGKQLKKVKEAVANRNNE